MTTSWRMGKVKRFGDTGSKVREHAHLTFSFWKVGGAGKSCLFEEYIWYALLSFQVSSEREESWEFWMCLSLSMWFRNRSFAFIAMEISEILCLSLWAKIWWREWNLTPNLTSINDKIQGSSMASGKLSQGISLTEAGELSRWPRESSNSSRTWPDSPDWICQTKLTYSILTIQGLAQCRASMEKSHVFSLFLFISMCT